MPDIPESAVQAAAEVLFRDYESQYSAGHLTWRDFADTAREVLTAATPKIREQIAAEILAQKTGCAEHPMPFPRPSCLVCGRDGAFHRAARIAAGTYQQPEDQDHGRD